MPLGKTHAQSPLGNLSPIQSGWIGPVALGTGAFLGWRDGGNPADIRIQKLTGPPPRNMLRRMCQPQARPASRGQTAAPPLLSCCFGVYPAPKAQGVHWTSQLG